MMAALLALSACGNPPRENRILTKAEAAERGLGDDAVGTDGSTIGELFVGGQDEATGQNLRVNKYIWRGALDTLSFLPLASTDPYSGVIVTDWGAAEAAAEAERFKVTVYISSEKLTADTLRVAVFREVRAKNGDWISAAVQAEVPRRIEDSILTRARQLRIADKEAEG